MKALVLIGLILAATSSVGIAAETVMTIRTDTTIRIDPRTGRIKGDAHTEMNGIRKHHETPDAFRSRLPTLPVPMRAVPQPQLQQQQPPIRTHFPRQLQQQPPWIRKLFLDRMGALPRVIPDPHASVRRLPPVGSRIEFAE
jgi:hypothetical protein